MLNKSKTIQAPASIDFHCKISTTLSQLQEVLDLDDVSWCTLFGLGVPLWLAIRSGTTEIPAPQLILLCQKLEINLDLLLRGKLDYSLIALRWKGNRLALPDRYCIEEHKLSRARSTQTVLKHLNLVFGTAFSNRMLSRLQIHPHYFSMESDEKVSSRINIDLLSELKQNGVKDSEIIKMGTLTLSVLKSSPVGDLLAEAPTPKTLYEFFFTGFSKLRVEALTEPKILHLTNQSVMVEVGIHPEAKEAFNSHIVGNRQSCLFRQGFLKSLLGMIRIKFASCEELTCMYAGDQACVYHLTWEPEKQRSNLSPMKVPELST